MMDGKDTTSVEDIVDLAIEQLRSGGKLLVPRNADEAELLAAATLVRSMRKSASATSGYGESLVSAVTAERDLVCQNMRSAPNIHSDSRAAVAEPLVPSARKSVRLAAGIAAGLVLLAGLTLGPKLWGRDMARAMAAAVARISSYHGILEKSYTTLAGDSEIVRRVEVWSSESMYATLLDDGTATVNNGEMKWQVRPAERTVAILPLLPDPDRTGLDLRDQADRATRYPYTKVGEETVAGRTTVCLEITPPGGLPYHLWIDKQTDLPLRLRTAMQNGIQTTYTYTLFTANPSDMDKTLFECTVPSGFTVVEEDPGQLVQTPTEAFGIAGFATDLPSTPPLHIYAFASGGIVIEYASDDPSVAQPMITVTAASGEFAPASGAALGWIDDTPVEITEDSLRWRKEALEITVSGPGSRTIARSMAEGLVFPGNIPDPAFTPAVSIEVDMEVERNEQEQVDGGHSPWRLDPVHVTMTFVNLLVSPEGIVGEPSTPYQAFSLAASDGQRSIVHVSEGPVARVYLEKLTRQDDSGIWSVVGYDPR